MPHPAEVSRLPNEGRRVAFAVLHEEPPRVFVAEDEYVLERVLAIEVVAATSPYDLSGGADASIRELLLNEQWGFAIQAWMQETHTVIDFYPDEYLWLDSQLTAERAALDARVSRIFTDPPA
jgi:hypothetical protein